MYRLRNISIHHNISIHQYLGCLHELEIQIFKKYDYLIGRKSPLVLHPKLSEWLDFLCHDLMFCNIVSFLCLQFENHDPIETYDDSEFRKIVNGNFPGMLRLLCVPIYSFANVIVKQFLCSTIFYFIFWFALLVRKLHWIALKCH